VEILTLIATLGLQKVIPAHNEAVVAIWHSMPTDTFLPEKKSASIMRSLPKKRGWGYFGLQ
jgi:hypothetical protein